MTKTSEPVTSPSAVSLYIVNPSSVSPSVVSSGSIGSRFVFGFGHCYLFDICNLGFVILYFHYFSKPTIST